MDNLGVNRSLKYSNSASTSSFTSTTAGSTDWSLPLFLLLPLAPAVAFEEEGGGDAGNTGMRRRFAGKSSTGMAPLPLALALDEDEPLSVLSEPLSFSRFTLKLPMYARTSETKAPTER